MECKIRPKKVYLIRSVIETSILFADDMFSHLDGVRCVAFHPMESLVVTGSEDRTIKLWNLDKAAMLRKFVH
jgi:WD40 repeat protein